MKIYMIYTVLLLLAGAAVLVVGTVFFNNYEKEQIRLLASVTPRATSTPMPTPTPIEVVVEKYRYSIEVPKSISVIGDNVTENGLNGDQLSVIVETETPGFEVKVKDEYGNEVSLKNDEKLEIKTFKVIVPDSYKVTLSDSLKSSEEYVASRTQHPDYKFCYDFADMPQILNYEFTNALEEPKIKILDNLDNEVEVKWTKNTFEKITPATLPHIPEGFMSEEEARQYVKTWSLFMTNDLKPEGFDAYIFTDKKTGERVPYKEGMNVYGLNYRSRAPKDHGFSVLKEYLLPGSYRYKALEEYAYSVDIGHTSRHLPDPAFLDERIDNFVMYSHDVFSVDVSFTKILILPTMNYAKRYDKTSVRVFFIKNPDSTSGRDWLMADMITLMEEKEIQEDNE